MESSRASPLADKSNAASEPERRASDGPKRERSSLPADVLPPTRSGAEEPGSSAEALASSSLASPVFARSGGAAQSKKRAFVEQAPKPVTRPLPEALKEWKEYAEGELRQLHAFRKQGLLDWPLVKGAINCAVVSCPVASLRQEMRALRDNGVYGSSMVPYLQVLRSVFDSAQECADDAEEAPAEFSESDDVSSSSSEDSEEASSEEDTEEDSTQSSEDTDGDKKRKRARVEGLEPKSKETPKKRSSDERATMNLSAASPENATARSGKKQNSKGASGSERVQTVLPPSAYQIEMRAKYKLFSRFLGAYFAKERLESASVASLVSHPDAVAFADAEIVAFLDMLQRENKVMLHEGTVMII
jgi:hypothetical protein